MTPGTESLGLADGQVRLAESDPAWADAAGALIGDVRSALGHHAAGVEHIGSTAIPGLAAKPIVDIAVLLDEDVALTSAIAMLTSRGWEFRSDVGDRGGVVFVLRDPRRLRIAHLHVLRAGDVQWRRYLLFRDHLRTDGAARAAYETAKRRLAAANPLDRVAYSDGKDGIVSLLLESVGRVGIEPTTKGL